MKTLIIALCLSVVPALASPTGCVAGTYQSYVALSGGCTIGDALFSNFSGLTFVNSPGVSTLATDQIQVMPSGTSTDAMLTFVFLDTNGDPLPVTLNTNGQIFSMGLSFDVVVSPSNLTGIQMGATFSNTAPANVSASKSVQLLAGGPQITSTVNDEGISNALGNHLGTLMPVSGVGTFLVTDTTSLQAQTGSVSEASFTNSFFLGPQTVPTPEIGSLLMIGTGLVFVSALASSTRRRKRAKGVDPGAL